jgi:limonene-1,2-epoxide hydrolase
MFGPLTTGVDTPEVAEEATNKVNWWGIPFDPNTQQYAALRVVRLPGNYDGGTVTFTLMWTATQSTGNVVWGVQAFAAADGDNIDTAWGTAQEVTDSLIGTSKVHVATTPALTIANTPAAGKYLYVRVYRKAADAADTLGAKAYLKHVTMEFSLSKLSKAV